MAKNGFSMSNRVAVERITGDKTLTVDDCGKTFIVDSVTQGSAVDITMPNRAAAGDGWNATFIMESGSGEGATPQNVVFSGSVGDSALAPFQVRGVSTDAVLGAIVETGQGQTVTITGTTLQNGDQVRITNVNGALLGYAWYVDAITSASINIG